MRNGTARDQRGFTLVELLVAMMISALIVAVVSSALITSMRSTAIAEESFTASGSAVKTTTWFADDVSMSQNVAEGPGVRRDVPGCGGDPHAVVRFVSTEPADGDDGILVHSYSLVDGASNRTLERRTCRGEDLDAALAAEPRIQRVVDRLADGDDVVEVTCRATPGADPAPAGADGDRQCRLVDLRAETEGGFAFELHGRQQPVRAPGESSTGAVRRCTMLATADTTIKSNNHDQVRGTFPELNTYMTTERRSAAMVRVDLFTPCIGSDEPEFLPGGKQLTSATLRLFYFAPTNFLYKDTEHELLPIADGDWEEGNMTWDRWEDLDFVVGGNRYSFQAPWNARNVWVDLPVLDEVTRWYQGEVNRGWILRRRDWGNHDNWFLSDDRNEEGYRWASRENPDPQTWPRLVVTW